MLRAIDGGKTSKVAELEALVRSGKLKRIDTFIFQDHVSSCNGKIYRRNSTVAEALFFYSRKYGLTQEEMAEKYLLLTSFNLDEENEK